MSERIFRAVSEAGLSLRELSTEEVSLEDVFTRLTADSSGVEEER